MGRAGLGRRAAAVSVFWIAAAAALPPIPLTGQEQGWILVRAPEGWRGEETRGLVVRLRRSVRVEGEAFHPAGITRVLIGGTEAALEPRPEGTVRFVGFLHPTAGTSDVEIVAYSRGAPMVRRFEYTVEPAAAAYDDPERAWAEGPGFRGERYAVVVGVSAYRDRTIASLEYADDDARMLYDFLVSDAAGLGGFEPENVRLLVDEGADFRSIRMALTGFLRRVTERDVVVFYFAGHGAPDPYDLDEYYFFPHDAEATNVAGTAYAMSDIWEAVNELRAENLVVLVDACHAAAVSTEAAFRATGVNDVHRVFLERMRARAGGLLVFSAAERNQLSREHERWGGGHGAFTYHLVQGLMGRADGDGDGIVTLGEVVEHTRESVRRDTEGAQVPAIGNHAWDRAWPMSIVTPDVVARGRVPRSLLELAGSETGPAPRSVAGVSPTGVLLHGLVLPGSGELRVGRSARGAAVLAGAVGATAYGLLATTRVTECAVPVVAGSCPGQVVATRTERRHLGYALAAAGALTLAGAVDAFLAARRTGPGGSRGVTDVSGAAALRVLPSAPAAHARPGDVPVFELRFR